MKVIDEKKLKCLIEEAKNIVFLGGAGVSTASGIPDFRSATGLYNRKTGSSYSPEYMLSHTFYKKNPEDFTRYYKENLIFKEARPNKAHIALAKLEDEGKLKAVITQNIDGLHQMAGSKNVIEIHGNLVDYYCTECGKTYTQDEVLKTEGLNICECGGIIRPDVVLYEEPLNKEKYDKAVEAIRGADMFIVGGSSLVVYPAAGLLRFFGGDKLVLINMEPTLKDEKCDFCIYGDISKILGDAVDVK